MVRSTNGDLSPADFHRMLLEWLGTKERGFVITFDRAGGEVWSNPVYRFDTQWVPDSVEAGLWHVETTVWMADSDVPPDLVGIKPFPGPAGQVLRYDLYGDPQDPTDGTWGTKTAADRLGPPSRIWYPSASLRNPQRALVSPALARSTSESILSAQSALMR
ncbi:MAG: hypothetical protein JOZ65_31470 [Chloroflexi bacterium]|nr:hypothetical protein [Chloroflexota bacterium]